MRIFVLPQSNPATDPCYRYRIAAFQPFFEQAGCSLETQTPPSTIWQWIQLIQTLHLYDVVILQRKLITRWQMYLLRMYSKKLIFDFDDAVFVRDSFSNKTPHCRKRLRRFNFIVKHADHIVAGNSFLAKHAARSNSTTIIPTCVDPHRYSLATHQKKPLTQLVWIGGSSTLQGLEHITSILNQIGIHVPETQLKLISDRFISLENMHVIPCHWSSETEASELAKADIGISWIPDDIWSKGKCGLKILQYMAAGLPVVTNSVGVHPDIVQHGITGFLVNTEQEWIAAVRTLSSDPALRKQFGESGRERVEKQYSVEVNAQKWLKLLAAMQ